MEKTLAVLNRMQADGIINRYAIGGAIAATRYIEPFHTSDIDVFVFLPFSTSGLVSISPIYTYLGRLGYEAQGEYINVEGWPVQFLPVYNSLSEEALSHAVEVNFGSTPTRVLSAEHLAAIMLETGRPKDYARLVQFIESDALDISKLHDILARNGLLTKWDSFHRKFIKEKEQS